MLGKLQHKPTPIELDHKAFFRNEESTTVHLWNNGENQNLFGQKCRLISWREEFFQPLSKRFFLSFGSNILRGTTSYVAKGIWGLVQILHFLGRNAKTIVRK